MSDITPNIATVNKSIFYLLSSLLGLCNMLISAQALSANICNKVFEESVPPSKWNEESVFSDKFTEGGFPVQLIELKNKIEYSSVQQLIANTPKDIEFYVVDFGFAKITKVEHINKGLYQFHFETERSNGEIETTKRSYQPTRLLAKASKAAAIYKQSLSAHSKRLFIKSFFRFGWYGFQITQKHISDNRKQSYRAMHIFNKHFPDQTVKQVNDLVTAFLRQPPTAEAKKNLIEPMRSVQSFLIEVKTEMGLDFVKVGVYYSAPLKSKWPLPLVKDPQTSGSLELTLRNIDDIRAYLALHGVEPLVRTDQQSPKELFPVKMTKQQFNEFMKSHPQYLLDGFGLTDILRFSLSLYNARSPGMIFDNKGATQVNKSKKVIESVTGSHYVLVTMEKGTDVDIQQRFFEYSIDAYKAGVRQVIPIIIIKNAE